MSQAAPFRPQNCPVTCVALDRHLTLHMVRWAHLSPRITVVTDQQTETPTERQTTLLRL